MFIECQQGSQEWLDTRAGAITASRFRDTRERIGGLDERQQRYVDAILDGASKADACAAAGYKGAPMSEAVARALAGQVVKPEFGSKALNYAWLIALERINPGMRLGDAPDRFTEAASSSPPA